MTAHVQVQGTCDPRFTKVKSMLQAYLEAGDELGASICVNIDGTDVLDLWGGFADASRTKAWEKDTITCIWSSTKTVCALAALLCIDRGLLDANEKVSKYWPEFAANGKENVEVRHLLSHAAGLSGWEKELSLEGMCDLDKSTEMLAQQAPWWEPGTAIGYHPFTMGHLIGGLIQRVTSLRIDEFIEKEITRPLSADFQLGAKEEDWSRVADIIPPPAPSEAAGNPEAFADPSSLPFRTLMQNPGLQAEWANGPTWRKAVMAAGNGYSNARGLVRILSAISLSSPDNPSSFLSPKAMDQIFVTQQQGTDLVLSVPVRFGLGLALPAENTIMGHLPQGRLGSWGGWGGSIVIADADRKITIGYVMNKMENAGLGQPEEGEKMGMGNFRLKKYLRAIYEALNINI